MGAEPRNFLIVDDDPDDLMTSGLFLKGKGLARDVKELDSQGMRPHEVAEAIDQLVASDGIEIALIDGQYLDGTALEVLQGIRSSVRVIVNSSNPFLVESMRRQAPQTTILDKLAGWDIFVDTIRKAL